MADKRVAPTGEDELRSSLMKALRAKRKREEGEKPPAAAEEIAPGVYQHGAPYGLPDPGIRLASAKRRRRAKIAAIRGGQVA